MEIKAAVKGNRILGLNTQAKPPFDTSLPLNEAFSVLPGYNRKAAALENPEGLLNFIVLALCAQCTIQIHRLKSKRSTAQMWETSIFTCY